MNGVVTRYANGHGQITLENGSVVNFDWHQVELPPDPERQMKPSNVGHGYALAVGDRVRYDRNNVVRPVHLA